MIYHLMIVTVGLYWLVGWLLLSDFSPEVEGIIVGGTTGEGHLLSLDERLGLISHTKARPEKMVGCTSPTQMARVRIEHVGDWGYIYIYKRVSKTLGDSCLDPVWVHSSK
jgi:hypothetical protein